MTNLLPEEHRIEVRSEYRLRFFAVLSLFTFFALGISIVALLPGAFSLGADYFSVRKIESQPTSTEEKILKELNVSLQTFRETLTTLDPKKESGAMLPSELVRSIIMQKPSKVAINSFSFLSESDTVQKLALNGIAADRESLVSFSKRLSENETFSEVDFPISNLSKKEKIDFSVTLTIKQKEPEETSGGSEAR